VTPGTDERRQDVDYARRRVATFGVDPADRDVSPMRAFTRKYGWRAYALPILIVITVVALLSVGNSGPGKTPVGGGAGTTGAGSDVSQSTPPPPVASGDTSVKVDQAGAGALDTVLKSGALPAGAAYTKHGTGTYSVVKGTSPVVGAGHLYRYDVEVENGITGVDRTQFATMVQTVLSDKRSWAGHGDVRLKRVDSGPVDFHVSLTSVDTNHKYCGYDIPVETSCYITQGENGVDANRVILSVARWVRGSMAYVGDLNAYRIYMINHEDGHAIGHQHAHQCLPGGQAPVMMQQTIGLKSATTGQMCAANPWPYPPGVKGTPGAEQADTEANSEYVLTGD
jgi:hypothetical protein